MKRIHSTHPISYCYCFALGGFRTDQVSLSAFAYLYSELVQYHQGRVSSLSELEQKLMGSGYGVGFKILELLAYRSREVSWFHKLLF